MQAVYEVFDDKAISSEHAGGPWDPAVQHGSAPAALVAWAAERIETTVPMRVARLTIDLLRPVPVAPLEIRTEILRQGRKIQLASILLIASGTEVVRASVLKVRELQTALDARIVTPSLDLPPPGDSHEQPARIKSAFLDGISMRYVKPGLWRPGPAAVWYRAGRPIVQGEEITPLMRAAITADFCNGTSAVLDQREWSFVNADLSLSLARMPLGEWILLDAETWLGPDGGGIAFARMADTTGYFGRAVQSLVIERRHDRVTAGNETK
jgi:hypothetical protein